LLRRVASLTLVAIVLNGVGCRRKTPDASPTPSTKAVADPNADGKRLAAALSTARPRFLGLVTAAGCAPPLTEVEAQQSCAPADLALKRLQTALLAKAPDAELLSRTAGTWLASERALKVLKKSSLGKWFEAHPRAIPSASSSARPSESEKPRASAPPKSVHEHAPVRVHDDPHAEVLAVYSRLETLTRRMLAAYLQFGPLKLRQRAFTELERLCREEPHAARLRDLTREAALVETDLELRKQLQGLRTRLGPD
jgi:hypothetical protein